MTVSGYYLLPPLSPCLEGLAKLALDLRWSEITPLTNYGNTLT
jgi:hypothetical protein